MANRDRKDEKLMTRKKVEETRRDIEHLQNELQKLIETGLQNANSAKNVLGNTSNINSGVNSDGNRVQIIKSYELQAAPSTGSDLRKSKSPSGHSCVRKERDQKQIQEYIKKQRERYKENLKIEKKSTKNEQELRKQKLQELQVKSRELVAKNVQASRARSKSRDRGDYLRIDKTQRSRSASNDRNRGNPKENHYLKPPIDNLAEKSFLVQSKSLAQSKNKNKNLVSNKNDLQINSERKLTIRNPQIPNKVEINCSDNLPKSEESKSKKSLNKKPDSSKITFLRRSSVEETDFSPTELDKGFIGEIILQEPEKNCLNSKSNDLQNKKSSLSIDKEPSNMDLVNKNSCPAKENCAESSNNIVNLDEYFEKRDQNQEITNWLRLTVPQPYPYNFINTAKRKLQYAINNSKPDQKLAEKDAKNNSPPRTPENNPKTRQELMELIQKSIIKTPVVPKNDLLSFESHKRLNLDPKPLEQLYLNKNRRHSEEEDSDTSKNIPEISSESCTSLKKNAESVKHLNSTNNLVISTERLDNMRLSPKKSSKGSQSSIVTDIASDHSTTKSSRRSKSSEDLKKQSGSYSSDFASNKSFELPKTASRESIISYFSCDHSKKSSKSSNKSTVSSLSSQSKHSNFTVIEENIPLSNSHSSKSKKSKQSNSSVEEEIEKSVPQKQRKNSIVEDMVSHFEALTKKIPSATSTSSSSSSVHSIDRNRESKQISSSAESVASSKVSKEKTTDRKSNLALQAPTVNLLQSSKINKMKNICIRQTEDAGKSNEIHLKFEAEIHLLNDFNESLKQLSAVEEAFESLKMHKLAEPKLLENRDTQTSNQLETKINTSNNNDKNLNSTQTSISELSSLNNNNINNKSSKSKQSSIVPTINFSRGSEFLETDTAEDTFNYFSTTTLDESNLNSVLSPEESVLDNINANNINQTVAVLDESSKNILNANPSKVANLSLAMFQQLIKDEDVRLENLKTILKIRERALLDRTNGALAYLQIQKKQLKETGKLDEVTLIRKKQRGILLKTHQERQEMRRLKTMQQAASTERKLLLKEQLKVIKLQLHADNMMAKVKEGTPRSSKSSEKRTSSGPLKVIQSESIRSETSMSRKSSIGEEVLSISSHSQSVISEVTTNLDKNVDVNGTGKKKLASKSLANLHRSLLMREAALHKRRQTAEELLQWHQRLLDEEKRIKELEESANRIIAQPPKDDKEHNAIKYNFTGRQLNNLWENLTGSKQKRFVENKVFPMSQLALERFCKSAKEYCSKFKRSSNESSNYGKTDNSFSELSDFFSPTVETAHSSSIETAADDIKSAQVDTEYTADFESVSNQNESKLEKEEESQLSAINKLIDNFSQVHENISLISQVSKKSLENVDKFKSVSENIETGKDIETEKEIETNKETETIHQSEDKVEMNPDKDSTDIEDDLSVDNELSKSEEITSVIASQKVNEDIQTDPINKESIDVPKSEETQNIQIDSEKTIQSQINEPETQSIVEESQNKSIDSTKPTLSSDIVTENHKNNDKSSSTSEDVSKSVESLADNKSSQKTSIASEMSNSAISSTNNSSSNSEISLEKKAKVDVKKRVLEIMADAASPNRGDKSPRLQDLYVTTYDVISPPVSPDGPPHQRSQVEGSSPRSPAKKSLFGSEAEELRRKQLAIEQEIKQLEQQQKEQLPYVFVREIPNKPPPPYTPPATLPAFHSTILPKTAEEIDEITKYSSKILYKAYISHNLENINISDNTLNLVLTKKEISKDCYKFVFDLCKEIAIGHYKEFEEGSGPEWLKVPRKPQLAHIRPLDSSGLEKLMSKKLKEMFGFSKSEIRENAIIKWSRKKRDHVDEILVMESQIEEADWLNYDKDEKILLDKVTNDIMKSLVAETANIFNSILIKRNSCC